MELSVKDKVYVTSTFGVLPTMTLVFVILKMAGVINWSWWWVFAPTWIPLCVAAIMLVIFLILIVLTKESAE